MLITAFAMLAGAGGAPCAAIAMGRGDKEKAEKYLVAAMNQWEFIKKCVIDKRNGSEWFWRVDVNGKPDEEKPIVEQWKCPYHNGRMCFEVMKRL